MTRPLPHPSAGTRYNRLTVISFHEFRPIGNQGKREPYFLCLCDCGVEKSLSFASLRTASAKSCGCLRKIVGGARLFKHGLARTKTYRLWLGMRARCSPDRKGKGIRFAKSYADKGIAVCERWQTYANFLADMGEAPEGMSIERDDNEGNYEPGNCRWATRFEQQNNRSNTVFLTLDGVTKPIADWARDRSIPRTTLQRRLRKGWSVQDAICRPVERQKNNVYKSSL